MSEANPNNVKPTTPIEPVDPRFHFVWYGAELPDFAAIAIASALRHNPECKAWLWHEPQLQPGVALRRLGAQGLELRPIAFAQLARQAATEGCRFDAARLTRIYERLSTPAARSNLLRQLALCVHGGIYLDTDTLTLRSLSKLRALGGFCGLEHVLWPSQRTKYHLGALGLDALRWVYGRARGGPWLHARLLRFYDQAANNAVLGFHRRHAFTEGLLEAATLVPEAEWLRRFRFGTHLLQQQLERAGELPQQHPVTQLPPAYFYPQGPVISLHYFRETQRLSLSKSQLLREETHVIHWYASVGKLLRHDARHIRSHQDAEVYSHLCAPYLHLFD